MKKHLILSCAIILALPLLAGCGNPEAAVAPISTVPVREEAAKPAATEATGGEGEAAGPYLGQTAADQAEREESKLCDWVDQSDIIVKVNFAPGVEKDISYETGFFFSPIFSHRKLARSGCDYRTGFSFEEMKGKGPAEVGAIGYSDNRRRTVQGAPVKVVFDADGKPDIGTAIEITVMD